MIYLMNSAVMPAGCYGTYRYAPATVEDLGAVVRGEHGEWVSAIGYPTDLQLIEVWTGVQPPLGRIEVHLTDGDEAFVMRLKTRMKDPGTKGAPVSAEPKDWEFAWVGFSAAATDIPPPFEGRFPLTDEFIDHAKRKGRE